MRFSILLISLLFCGLPSEFDAQVFIDECSVFEAGPNETWTHVLTAVTAEDPESGSEQVLEINVSSLGTFLYKEPFSMEPQEKNQSLSCVRE